jgi:ABC-type antimicrobial peptide transport system permease subunit
MNLESYLENIKDVPMQVHIEAKEGTNLPSLKEKIEKNIKETGVKISTAEEYLETQKKQVDGIMSIFYIIIGLAVILSFIGIINNQIICFIQRRKELAILNSTCMSKKQLKRMLRIETILSNAISCLIAVGVGFIATDIIETFLETLSMYVEMIFDWNMAFKFIGIVFILLLCTLRIPTKRMKKMNIVSEIKYE